MRRRIWGYQEKTPTLPAEKPASPPELLALTPKPVRKRRRLLLLVAIFAVALLLFFGIPQLIRAFNTVSTDDAYVNGHVTFVAPRVSGQVARLLVEDNNPGEKRRCAASAWPHI
jgi:membrane fusion protein, multidrug efflux system